MKNWDEIKSAQPGQHFRLDILTKPSIVRIIGQSGVGIRAVVSAGPKTGQELDLKPGNIFEFCSEKPA